MATARRTTTGTSHCESDEGEKCSERPVEVVRNNTVTQDGSQETYAVSTKASLWTDSERWRDKGAIGDLPSQVASGNRLEAIKSRVFRRRDLRRSTHSGKNGQQFESWWT